MLTPNNVFTGALGIALVCALAYIGMLRLDRAELKAENKKLTFESSQLKASNVLLQESIDSIEKTNKENVAALAQLTKDYQAAQTIWSVEHAANSFKLKEADLTLGKLKEALHNVKAEEDGPISPVLVQLLDQLCRLQAAATYRSSSDGGEGGSHAAANTACGESPDALAARPAVHKQSDFALYVAELWKTAMKNLLTLTSVNETVWPEGVPAK